MGKVILNIFLKNKHENTRKFVPSMKDFACDHSKIIFPLVTIATCENKFSMVTHRGKKHLTLTRTNILYITSK